MPKQNNAAATKNKFKLSIYDRISLPSILPDKATIEKAIICNSIREKIQLSTPEVQKIKLRTVGNGRLTWEENIKDKIVEFEDIELELISNGFKELNTKQEVPTEKPFIELYKKFVK